LPFYEKTDRTKPTLIRLLQDHYYKQVHFLIPVPNRPFAVNKELFIDAIKQYHTLAEEIKKGADWHEIIKEHWEAELSKEGEAEANEDSEEETLVGLREEIDDLLDRITHDISIEVPGLAGIHGVTPDVVEAEIEKAKASRGIEEPTPAEEADDKSRRGWTMEEAEFLYSLIEEDIEDLPEEDQVKVRQFLKLNYSAYPTYGWRDKLKLEALETLAETLDQIQRGIKEKGLEAFGLSQPEQPTQPLIESLGTSDAEAKAQADASGATDQMLSGYIADVKHALNDLFGTEQVPLVIKYPAEELLEAIEKYLLSIGMEVQ
ncbi:MAG: hypothetical protein OXI63_11630, partial [Candidatus Poribacteria bacterium]|nr:hypothetical protein [Candidatus Poribacteria bacterium]